MSAAQATGTGTDPATTSTAALPCAAATATTPAHRATKDTTVSTPIIDNNALTASLRALKLSGMPQTLDARLGPVPRR